MAFPFVYLEGLRRGPRIGLIVPRLKYSAVARNQLKRRLRELVRLNLVPTTLSIDIVLRIRSETYQASFEALQTDISRVVSQLKQHDNLMV